MTFDNSLKWRLPFANHNEKNSQLYNKSAYRNWRLFLACFHLEVPGKHHYYLNVDRCAFGGNLKLSAQVKGIPSNDQVCGPIIFAVNHNCSAVYYYQDSPDEGWKQYQSVKNSSYLRKFLQCKPVKEFDWYDKLIEDPQFLRIRSTCKYSDLPSLAKVVIHQVACDDRSTFSF